MRHTPLIRFQAARTALATAREACPHWDLDGSFDTTDGDPYDCCYAVMEAARELKLARIANEKGAK